MRNAFKRRDWNAVMDEEGKLDHTAELLLADGIDTPASPGLQQLRAGDLGLAPRDRVAVGAFIAAQMGRAPHFRETLGSSRPRSPSTCSRSPHSTTAMSAGRR